MNLAMIDIAVLAIYAVAIFGLAQWVSRDKGGHQKDSTDYFLAGKALPWWAIGASLIAANISAEQIIGMSGSGYAIGLAIASYEWMAALTLLIVGKFFLPVFLKNGVYTMPQFLEQRYGPSVRTLMAVFWLGLYVFVNLTSILWLGSIAVHTVTGLDQMWALAAIGAFALAYQIWGGLKAVALTDIVQVALLVTGGLIIAWLSLGKIGGGDVVAGFHHLTTQFPEKFDMILSKDNPHYKDLPGIAVLIGGLWIMNISYWGFNQYIIQRALGAKDLAEAQKGIAMAAYLKLLMPVIVVLPGIAALVLAPEGIKPDQAYPEMMKLLPPGLLGLVFAALVAAIVASLAAKINSIATIFTLDVYAKARPNHSEGHLVTVGRITAVVAVIIGVLTAKPLLGGAEQAFQFIQEFTGFFTPGIVVIFILGMFWKKATTAGALTAAIGSAVLSAVFWWLQEKGIYAMPFMNRVGVVFLLSLAGAVLVSLAAPQKKVVSVVTLEGVSYKTSTGFNIAGVGVVLILIALYATWW
ncbi:sodium/sugar symporter [Caulobacter segnis]|uniref:SSS sodium solute transporter superfamily n=1 Tax=Caulobacter segnis (strain ATCC 21756 / DSM 7131 / JCM 7823 / NBRC 15250 / LMG 17158 / TK0059) TaxID=509190 RepID=D5VND1_CAUST|nr:sodium/sugar symporter [Caulobacter segnis]ADG12004.1 SSS sodium solute transporter superfamily [Caulobacter segnis ATCC 21756]